MYFIPWHPDKKKHIFHSKTHLLSPLPSTKDPSIHKHSGQSDIYQPEGIIIIKKWPSLQFSVEHEVSFSKYQPFTVLCRSETYFH